MENILWHQTSENKSNDVISFNGKLITPPTNPLYIEKFDYLYNIDKKVRNKKVNSNSDSRIYHLSNGIFMKGYFRETDNHGRNIVFMFYSDTTNIEVYIRRLKNEAAVCDKTCSESLIADIRDSKSSILSLKSLLIALSILAIIVILIALVNNK